MNVSLEREEIFSASRSSWKSFLRRQLIEHSRPETKPDEILSKDSSGSAIVSSCWSLILCNMMRKQKSFHNVHHQSWDFHLSDSKWNLHKNRSWCTLIDDSDLCKHCIWERLENCKKLHVAIRCASTWWCTWHLRSNCDVEPEKWLSKCIWASSDWVDWDFCRINIRWKLQLHSNLTGSPTHVDPSLFVCVASLTSFTPFKEFPKMIKKLLKKAPLKRNDREQNWVAWVIKMFIPVAQFPSNYFFHSPSLVRTLS